MPELLITGTYHRATCRSAMGDPDRHNGAETFLSPSDVAQRIAHTRVRGDAGGNTLLHVSQSYNSTAHPIIAIGSTV